MFFCFKQKTAYEMLISDWSSDVCSSDLDLSSLFDGKVLLQFPKPIDLLKNFIMIGLGEDQNPIVVDFFAGSGTTAAAALQLSSEIGRATCRERVCQYV